MFGFLLILVFLLLYCHIKCIFYNSNRGCRSINAATLQHPQQIFLIYFIFRPLRKILETSIAKQKRKAISLETKIALLVRLRNGEGPTSLGRIFGLNEATVRTITRNEAAIRQSVVSGTKLSAKFLPYTRDSIKE